MYLVWINTPINFTFSDDFLKEILAGDINSLNLLVVSSAAVIRVGDAPLIELGSKK